MMMLVAMTSISWLVGESPLLGIICTCLGILLSTMGIDIVSGTIRYDFGNMYLLSGTNFIPLVIGFIGMAQVLELAEGPKGSANVDEGLGKQLTLRKSLLSKDEFKRILRPSIRSGLLGTFIGFLPGAGATAGSFLSYALEMMRAMAKDWVICPWVRAPWRALPPPRLPTMRPPQAPSVLC